MTKTILVMAAGTGGHVFPALAVAHALAALEYRIIWLGTATGLEAEKVRAAGFTFYDVPITGLRGKRLKTLLQAPFLVVAATLKAWQIIRKEKPLVAVGFGGYITGPGGLAAYLAGIPVVIHEQNAVLGLSNRLLSCIAKRCLEAFPDSFPKKRRAILTGNPIRTDFTVIPPPEKRLKDRQGKVRLLVLGGSLGAQVLNQVVPQVMRNLPEAIRPQVRHQTGAKLYESTRQAYVDLAEVEVLPFIEDMAKSYEWADVIICRAGALTVAEVAAVGIPAIFVPFLHAVDDHQTINANSLVKNGAAFLLPQSECNALRLNALLTPLLKDPDLRLRVASKAREAAILDATARVRDGIMEVIK